MASIGGSYNPDAEPSNDTGGFTPIPAGHYDIEVVESDYGANSKGNGMNLKMKAQVIDGEFADRVLYLNFGLEHTNTGWANGEQSRFAAFRHSVGVLHADDSEEFHYKKLRAVVDIEKGADGKERNVVTEYLWGAEAEESRKSPRNDNAPQSRQSSQRQEPTKVTPGAAAKATPWRQK